MKSLHRLSLLSTLVPLADERITRSGGYTLAPDSAIKVAVLGHTPGKRNETSFDVRVFLEFPQKKGKKEQGRRIVAIRNMSITTTASDDDASPAAPQVLRSWCFNKTEVDLAALAHWVEQHMTVAIGDSTEDAEDLSVRFTFAVNMAEPDKPVRQISRSIAFHAHVIPGFFVPGSGKAALTEEGVATAQTEIAEAYSS